MAGLKPIDLRVENATTPLGLDEPRPRLSWRLAADPDAHDVRQTAYRLQVADSEHALADGQPLTWDSQEVRSRESVGIDYAGPTLSPRRRYFWRVRVTDQDGQQGPWSDPSWWEMGLGDAAAWQACWIGQPPLHAIEPRLEGCSRIWAAGAANRAAFRHAFDVPAGARILSCGLAGGGERALVWLNGQRITLGEDAAAHVRFGRNVIAVESSAPCVLRMLIASTDRPPLTLETNDTWLAHSDPQGDWRSPDYDDATWRRAERVGRYGDPPWGREPAANRPSPFLRKAFDLTAAITRARLYISALGVYEAHLNGQRVGDDVLMPGWTDYFLRVPYQVYDVTDLLRPGGNVLGAILGDGWYAGYLGFMGPARYGQQPLLIAQLEIDHADGSRTVVTSDDSWQCSTAEIVYSDQQMGETIDARLRQDGWDTLAFAAERWTRAAVHEPTTRLEAEVAPRMAVQIDLQPISLAERRAGAFVFDLDQNLVGWVRLTAKGERGHKIIVRFAEVLNPDGTLHTANLRSAQVTDEFILRGDPDGEVFEPRFTHHGFRYVEVTNYPGTPDLNTLVGRVVYARLPVTGTFECSNPLINRLQENIQWGQRGNFLSVPTDCPQRDERLGWTGDAQVFCATAIYNMDVQRFMAKWLVDLMDAQLPSGAVTHYAPVPRDTPRHGSGGACGWADAMVIVPWTLYWWYGDRRVLDQCYAGCVAWVDFMERTSQGLIRPDEGFGDWLSIDADTPKDLIGTAYFAYSARLLSRIADVLGKADEAQHYAQLADRVRAAFRDRFVRGGGHVEGETQTSYVLALYTGMLEPDEEPRAAEHLIEDIEYRNGHLSTGFLGTPWLLPALSRTGHEDTAFRLLLQDTMPSWLFPVKNGATTMWERWDGWSEGKGFHSPSTTEGVRTHNMNSFNHYAYGCVGDWLYGRVAGVECLAPGFARVRVRPRPGGDLTWVRASYASVRGTIGCDWRLDEDAFRLEVQIPPNVTAEVCLPDGQSYEVGSGHHQFEVMSERRVPV
jgi:alpha-L-rhamnosidase